MHILRKDIFGLFLTHLHTRKHCRSVSMNYIIIEQFSERNHQVLMLTKYKIGPKQSILGISFLWSPFMWSNCKSNFWKNQIRLQIGFSPSVTCWMYAMYDVSTSNSSRLVRSKIEKWQTKLVKTAAFCATFTN